MHNDDGTAEISRKLFRTWIKGERRDIIPNIRAREYSRLGHLGLSRINRDRNIAF